MRVFHHSTILFFLFLLSLQHTIAQNSDPIVYVIVDSVVVPRLEQISSEMKESDIAYLQVIENRDTIAKLGMPEASKVILIFTKEYKQRSAFQKQIPSSAVLNQRSKLIYYHDTLYSGPVIDYYYNGRKKAEGAYLHGVKDGEQLTYDKEGRLLSRERFGMGKSEGVWENYFSNGKIEQHKEFLNGVGQGKLISFYSTGKIREVETFINGVATSNEVNKKIHLLMQKGYQASFSGNNAEALDDYNKALALDSNFARGYYFRGLVKKKMFQYNASIRDFTTSLELEPLDGLAAGERALARIDKYDFASSRKLMENSEITVLATKKKVVIPPDELKRICEDIHFAIDANGSSHAIAEALQLYCPNE